MTSRWTLARVAGTIALALSAAPWAVAAPSKPHRPPKIFHRPDVVHLPDALKDRLVELNGRPHSFPPLTIFAEAVQPSMIFQYYLPRTVEDSILRPTQNGRYTDQREFATIHLEVHAWRPFPGERR